MSFQYYGMLSGGSTDPKGGSHSWSVCATAILLELQKRGYSFQSLSTNGAQSIHAQLQSTLVPLQAIPNGHTIRYSYNLLPTEVSLSYTIPNNLPKIPAKYRIHIYNYETTVLPAHFAQLMKSHAHLILPSSNFSKQIFAMNGVPENRMVVVPHGVNHSIYHPAVAPAAIDGIDNQKFKFLTVAILHWRKGYDVLLKAYIEEFKGDDSVVLIIKTSRDPGEMTMPCHVNLQTIIADLKKTHDYKWPDIRQISQRFDNLASLYNTANVMVLPSRAECFSLTPIEASACKIPVITTAYGGHLDFLNETNSYLIDYKLRQAPKEGQYWHYAKNALCAEPDIEHFKSLMRHVKNNYDEAKAKAEIAYTDTLKYTWSNATDQIVHLVNERGWKL